MRFRGGYDSTVVGFGIVLFRGSDHVMWDVGVNGKIEQRWHVPWHLVLHLGPWFLGLEERHK